MICKDNQRIIDTLLRLKDTSSSSRSTTVNRIGSYQDSTITTMRCGKSISELMDQGNNNKIASTSKVGELADFQRLLKTYIH